MRVPFQCLLTRQWVTDIGGNIWYSIRDDGAQIERPERDSCEDPQPFEIRHELLYRGLAFVSLEHNMRTQLVERRSWESSSSWRSLRLGDENVRNQCLEKSCRVSRYAPIAWVGSAVYTLVQSRRRSHGHVLRCQDAAKKCLCLTCEQWIQLGRK